MPSPSSPPSPSPSAQPLWPGGGGKRWSLTAIATGIFAFAVLAAVVVSRVLQWWEELRLRGVRSRIRAGWIVWATWWVAWQSVRVAFTAVVLISTSLLRFLRCAVERGDPPQPCGICFEVVERAFAFGCGHSFCRECSQGFVTRKVNDGELFFACPSVGCNRSLDSNEVMQLVPDPVLQSRYLRSLARRTPPPRGEVCVECPRACGSFFYVPETDPPDLLCPQCFAPFCRLCNAIGGHAGRSCVQHRQWLEQNNEAEALYARYRAENNVQPCPGCGHACELLEGCKAARCTGRCQTRFCILCGLSLPDNAYCPHFFNNPYGDRCRGNPGRNPRLVE